MNQRNRELALISVLWVASSVFAQPPRLQALTDNYARGNLTAKQVVELVGMHDRLGESEANTAFGNQLMWWWAVENQLDEEQASQQLIAAYQQQHGNVPAAFRDRLRQALAGLPAPGAGVYFPPTHVVSGPLTPLPLPFVLGRPRLGPTEKSAISQISAGIRRPRIP